jgi:co-chaperonin GroES (HSP10)
MNAKKLRGEYVLIEPQEEEKTASGITLAKQPGQGDFSVGIVKIVGTGKSAPMSEYVPIDLSVGDKVLFQYGEKVKIGETFLLLVNEADIKIILE